MLQEIQANTLKMNRKIKEFCWKIEDFKKKEPNGNITMEKYNNQDKKIHQMATIIQLRWEEKVSELEYIDQEKFLNLNKREEK